MQFLSIASGSSGNCLYAGNDNNSVLIDAGISKKKIVGGLETINVNPENIDGILITHEHSDHIKGLGVMLRAYNTKVYATQETFDEILRSSGIGKVDTSLFNCVVPDKDIMIGSLKVHPFSISHDAANPICYTISDSSGKIGIATDLGYYDDYVVDNLMDSQILLLEANHDINMLQVGIYPYKLKQRILGNMGHLSNENSGRLICRLLDGGLKHVFLGHLSKENNYPQLAYETVKAEIKSDHPDILDRLNLQVADRDLPSTPVII